ncbi:MAG: Methyltransferase type 12 [Parcubacteria group bacterium GW2011_GWC1_43_30]|nr:MAG: Methyltransferase type 12 [Parcubacteria group bacterium GW2011_GWC1_43_30]
MKIALLDSKIGAMTRSSKYVVNAVVRNFSNKSLQRVIEYGPGDGVVTREILKRMPRDGELIVVETNPKFIKILRNINDPRLKIVEGTAQRVSEELKRDNHVVANLVISSIPLSILKPIERERIVDNTFEILEESGKFIVFQYSPRLGVYGIVYVSAKNQKLRPGEEIKILGREHISVGAAHPAYNSNPPTSGWH